jgi:hypothetical protein
LTCALCYERFETAAALFVIFKLIETGAGWGEEHCVAGSRRFDR